MFLISIFIGINKVGNLELCFPNILKKRMKDWDKTGKVKAIILGVFLLPNLISPIGAQPKMGFTMIAIPLIFGVMAIPLITKFNAVIFGQVIEKPKWNDNPLHLKKPLSFFQFGAYFFLSTGLGMIIGSLINYQQLNLFGLATISLGLGVLLGIQLLLRIAQKQE
ncbi:hypothetical protein [Cyclobacterium marinum]|nr:hypothetical protein [Cyclobacterium marinum]MBR9777951.1 hypothetical protein [Cytophagales bacterium]